MESGERQPPGLGHPPMPDELSRPDSPVTMSMEQGVAVITFNRPDVLNVFSGTMGTLLSEAYRICDEKDEIRVAVVTGSGRAFCAGADMNPASSSFGSATAEFSAQPLRFPAWRVRKPVIAALNGHAIGIGFTIAMQCDIRVVAADAKLSIPQVRRGVLGDAGSHWTVRQFSSLAAAADVLLTGRTFLGVEAKELGLVSRVVSGDEVLSTARAIADEIATHCSPVSMAMSKRLLWADLDLDETIDRESAYHRVVMGDEDAIEGPRAWSERRSPQWRRTVSDAWPDVLAAEEHAARLRNNSEETSS